MTQKDGIGVSSHLHRFESRAARCPTPTEFVNEGRIWRLGWAHQIPYRSLTPKKGGMREPAGIGRASFSHVAFCSHQQESV